MKREKSAGLNRAQVPTAQSQFSRGCSAKTPVARTEAAVTTTAGTDPLAPGERRGRSGAHLGLGSISAGKGQGPVPKPLTRLAIPFARQSPSER